MNNSNQPICSDDKDTDDPSGNLDHTTHQQEPESSKGPQNQNNRKSIRSIRNPYKGVYFKKRQGKWTSEIRDPITHARVYLGIFTSAEAAYEAYCTKKLEIDSRSASYKKPKPESDAKAASIRKCHLPSQRLEVNTHRKNTYKGIYMTKAGKWTSVINDPYTHIQFNLGTFATEEAAYEAYCASKLELDQKQAASNEKAARRTSCEREKRERKPVRKYEIESPKKKPRINLGDVPYKGVTKKPSGKFDAAIWDPVSKTRCYLGLFESAEAAHSAYCAKKLQIDKKISKFGKSCKKLEIDEKNKKKLVPKDEKELQEVAASVLSEFSLLGECKPCLEKTEDFGEKSDFVQGIVDENGILLGEFCRIDDLAICDVDAL